MNLLPSLFKKSENKNCFSLTTLYKENANEAYIFCFFEFTLLARESKKVETKVAMVTQWFIELNF